MTKADVEIDPERQRLAEKRLDSAMRDVRYHEQQAAVALARAQSIAKTWGLDIPESKQ